jgi:hypothetical protein
MRLAHIAPCPKNEGSYYREANTHPLCCRILLFNRFDRRFVHRSSPIGNRLRIFRGQNGKWRNSQSERYDGGSPNSSNWNVGACNQPTQWSYDGGSYQRPRTIRARPDHRRDPSGSPYVGFLGSGIRHTKRHRPPWLTVQRWLTQRRQVSVNVLSAIIYCRLVSRGLAVRISALCAPRVPWSDMALHLQTPPTSRLLLPHCTSSFCGHFSLSAQISSQSVASAFPAIGLLSAASVCGLFHFKPSVR